MLKTANMEMHLQLTLGPNSYAAMLLVLKMSRLCVLSDSTFGNLLRYENAVDPNVLLAIETVLERDGQKTPLGLDYPGAASVVVACDIIRKMFACDAVDYVLKELGIKELDEIVRYNIINYADTLIVEINDFKPFAAQIKKVIEESNKKIFPC